MKKEKRFKPEVRKPEILAAALSLAHAKGYQNVTRKEIAEAVGISGPSVQYHFGTMQQLRGDLMRYAVKQRDAVVVAQGLTNKDARALSADSDLKNAARATL